MLKELGVRIFWIILISWRMWRRIFGTNLRTNVLSQSVTFIVCSDGVSRRLQLNVLSSIQVEFIFETYVYLNAFCLHISAYQHFYNLIFYYNFTSRPVSAVSYLGSSHFDDCWCLNQPRHFMVFFSPPVIIPWYYCTVQLNNVPHCPFHSFQCQPVTHQCTTCPLTVMSLCVPEVHKCVYFRFISTGSLCRGREFYQLDMTT